MMLTLDARKNLLDVVEAAHEARAQVEAAGSKRGPRLWLVELIEPGPQRVVDDPLERQPAFASQLLQARGDVLFQCQCGTHVLMS